MHIHLCTGIDIFVYLYERGAGMHICCVYIIYGYVYIYIFASIYMIIYTYLYTYIYVYICMHICIHAEAISAT